MTSRPTLLLTGATGLLGRTLRHRLAGGYELVCPTHGDLDVTRREQVDGLLAEIRPQYVVHCAAMTNVDLCEFQQELAFAVNATGARNVARAAHAIGARLISFSTDYVFDGTLDRPYREDDFADNAQTVYGCSKRAGELAVLEESPGALVCRISWLYGPSGPDFPHAMLGKAGTAPTLKVVDDQRGNPTSTLAVAERLPELLEREDISGILHLSCEGETTWFGFAEELYRMMDIAQKIERCTTEEFPRPARRPRNSRLEKARLRTLGMESMPHWKTALLQMKNRW